MEEIIIGIDNFLKYKIIKINEEYSTYIVVEWNKKYFKEVEEGFLKIKSNRYYKPYNYALSTIIPYVKRNKNLVDLKGIIYLLYQDIKCTIPRAKLNKEYYYITDNLSVRCKTETESDEDDLFYLTYNYFLDIKEAIYYARELREYLKKLREK